MQPQICCVCMKILNSTDQKTFEDDLSVDFYESLDNKEPGASKKCVKLYNGIELVVGKKMPNIGKIPGKVCEECCTKLENFLNYRAQLLNSINKLYESTVNDEGTDEVPSSSYTENNRIFGTNEEYELGKNYNTCKLLEQRVSPHDVINVDENSVPYNTCLTEEGQNNDYMEDNKPQNDQDNNNFSQSDTSNSSDEHDSKEMILRVEKNDIESDIDVCSGDDDEVLELDIQHGKDETVEISSSSESDIEVCDYEPSGKKLKDYSALSPLIHF